MNMSVCGGKRHAVSFIELKLGGLCNEMTHNCLAVIGHAAVTQFLSLFKRRRP